MVATDLAPRGRARLDPGRLLARRAHDRAPVRRSRSSSAPSTVFFDVAWSTLLHARRAARGRRGGEREAEHQPLDVVRARAARCGRARAGARCGDGAARRRALLRRLGALPAQDPHRRAAARRRRTARASAAGWPGASASSSGSRSCGRSSCARPRSTSSTSPSSRSSCSTWRGSSTSPPARSASCSASARSAALAGTAVGAGASAGGSASARRSMVGAVLFPRRCSSSRSPPARRRSSGRC